MGAPMKSTFSGVADLLSTGKSLHRAAVATYGKPVEEAMRMGISFMPVDDTETHSITIENFKKLGDSP